MMGNNMVKSTKTSTARTFDTALPLLEIDPMGACVGAYVNNVRKGILQPGLYMR